MTTSIPIFDLAKLQLCKVFYVIKCIHCVHSSCPPSLNLRLSTSLLKLQCNGCICIKLLPDRQCWCLLAVVISCERMICGGEWMLVSYCKLEKQIDFIQLLKCRTPGSSRINALKMKSNSSMAGGLITGVSGMSATSFDLTQPIKAGEDNFKSDQTPRGALTPRSSSYVAPESARAERSTDSQNRASLLGSPPAPLNVEASGGSLLSSGANKKVGFYCTRCRLTTPMSEPLQSCKLHTSHLHFCKHALTCQQRNPHCLCQLEGFQADKWCAGSPQEVVYKQD